MWIEDISSTVINLYYILVLNMLNMHDMQSRDYFRYDKDLDVNTDVVRFCDFAGKTSHNPEVGGSNPPPTIRKSSRHNHLGWPAFLLVTCV